MWTGRHAIFVAFNDRHWRYAQPCLKSLVDNYPAHPEILALYDGHRPGVLAKLRTIPRLTLLDPARFQPGSGEGAAGWSISYRRFLLWTDRFEEYDRILYLDADTLVLKPLDALFERDGFFAVTNRFPGPRGSIFRPDRQGEPALRELLAEDGLHFPTSPDETINSGVFVIPRELRRSEHFEELDYLARRYRDYGQYDDQAVVSLWCLRHKIRASLCFEFNYQSHFLFQPDVPTALDEAAILHFSNHKPDRYGFLKWDDLRPHAPRLRRLFRGYQEGGPMRSAWWFAVDAAHHLRVRMRRFRRALRARLRAAGP